jgi:hypothetical protein
MDGKKTGRAHDHDHDHHHNHEHEHNHDRIGISRHDGSVIGTLTCSLPLRYQDALAAAEQRMRALAEDIVKKGGIIGHIKSLLTEEGRRCMLSITGIDTGVQRRILGGETSRLELVVIVFCIDDDTLRLCIRRAFAEYIPPGTGSLPRGG